MDLVSSLDSIVVAVLALIVLVQTVPFTSLRQHDIIEAKKPATVRMTFILQIFSHQLTNK